MCGIAGICGSRPQSLDQLASVLADMTSALVHRGPDEEGQYVTPEVALGSRRLRVIDLETGRMPIANEDGSVHVVYNGEIYNYRELRADLQRAGHAFSTSSDTEVLVHLYEQWGADLVRHLRGMFAFALWDDRTKTLLLARDRLGIKPLFYRQSEGTLTFGSELKALVAAAGQRPALNLAAVAEYLALGYVRSPRTIYQGYHRLPPGMVLAFQQGRTSITPYWRFPTSAGPTPANPAEALEALDELVERAVRERLVADVPLGAFLSGGVDSSLVVAFVARHVGGRLKTFSVGFPGDDELPFARMVAERYGTDHHELIVDPQSCHIGPELLAFFDEPFGDSSSIPTYYVSELARRHVTVALSGDGGDELFAGYSQYGFDARWAWVERVPLGLRRPMLAGLVRALPPSSRGYNLLRALGASRAERFTQYRAFPLNPRWGGILHSDLYSALQPSEGHFAEAFGAAAALPFEARLLYVDGTSYLPDDILAKVDRMSMAHSLEARVPLLDHSIVEFASGVPYEWKLRRGQSKWLLKRLAERYVPRDVLYRKKRGFAIPLRSWFNDELREGLSVLESRDARSRQFVHQPTVARLAREHESGRRDHADMLWRLLMLEHWLQQQPAPLVAADPSAEHASDRQSQAARGVA